MYRKLWYHVDERDVSATLQIGLFYPKETIFYN